MSKMTLVLLPMFLFGCSTSAPIKHNWHADNWSRLETYLTAIRPETSAVAIFDWDNTVIKNDVGDAVMLWMLSHDLIQNLQWSESRWLSIAAKKALIKDCPGAVGSALPTSTNLVCADQIASVYFEGKILSGEAAWKSKFNADTFEPAYAWLASLLIYTEAEIKKIAEDAIAFNLKNDVAATQKVGTKTYPAFLRVYPEIKDLIAKLQAEGSDVWVVSASPQLVVEVFARHVNVVPQKVIGIRNVMANDGIFTSDFLGCGTYPDRNQEIITYRQGKRCWINKIVFGLKNPKEQLEKPSPISFAAGDSDTDAFILRDAKDLRLVINRNKPEVMCHALATQEGNWLINPMFILPKPKKDSPYSCKVYGLIDQVE